MALVNLWNRLKRSNRSQKRDISKKTYFSYVFDSFSCFLCQKSKYVMSICSLRSFLEIDVSDSIFFTNDLIFWSQKMSDSIENPMIEFPTLQQREEMHVADSPKYFCEHVSITNVYQWREEMPVADTGTP